MATFHQHLREVVDPDLEISVRHSALVFLLMKMALRTYRGSIVDGDYGAFCRAHRRSYNLRFGFDNRPTAEPHQLVHAANFAYAEYNKLRKVQEILHRRRVSQKLRGWRRRSHADQEADWSIWLSAVAEYRQKLERA